MDASPYYMGRSRAGTGLQCAFIRRALCVEIQNGALGNGICTRPFRRQAEFLFRRSRMSGLTPGLDAIYIVSRYI